MKNLNHNLCFNKLRVRGLKPLELGVSIGAIKNKMLLNMMEVELCQKTRNEFPMVIYNTLIEQNG